MFTDTQFNVSTPLIVKLRNKLIRIPCILLKGMPARVLCFACFSTCTASVKQKYLSLRSKWPCQSKISKFRLYKHIHFFVTKIKAAYCAYIVAAFHCILPTGKGIKCVKYMSINVQQDATVHSLFYLYTALRVSGGFSTHHKQHA